MSTTLFGVVPLDHAVVSDADRDRIRQVYAALFAVGCIAYDPALDDDFCNPCKYYSAERGGAYFVARAAEVFTEAEGDAPSDIVATLGVRSLAMAAGTPTAESFIAGIRDPAAQAIVRRILAEDSNSNKSTSRVCELKRMASLPSCRGQGVGKALLQAALTWARTAGGYAVAVLDTGRILVAANHIYEHHGGFVDCGNYNGNPRADRFMFKLL